MKIANVHVKCFRSLGDVRADLADYTCLIGKNDSGKSSFLRALQLLFDPEAVPSPDDKCKIEGVDDDWFVEATLRDCDPCHELATDGQIRVRRLLDERPSSWEYLGKVPKLPALSTMRVGKLTRTAYQSDSQLSPQVKRIVDATLAERAPPGRVPPEVWKEAFQRLVVADLVEWKDGWCPITSEQLSSLVHPIMLQADVRAEEQVADRGKSIFGELGGLLVREATERHVGLQSALAKLNDEIEAFSGRDESGRWRVEELNRLEAVLEEEMKRFDDEINVQHELEAPKLPSLDFGVKIDVGDEWVTGLANMGHGLRRSLVFAMLRTLRRLKEVRLPSGDEGSGRISAPLYLFLIEEPELYLHPQAERRHMRELEELSQLADAQVVLSTHSAFFVDLNEYRGILRFDRPGRKFTTIQQWEGQDLEPADKKTLQTTYFFDPTRAAMLFADRVILVEGQTEKVTVPPLAEKMGLPTDNASIEVVDCGGNTNIPIYQRVLEEFKIKYVAWLDCKSKEKDGVERAKATRSQEIGRIVLTDGNWERMAGLGGPKGKAFKSWQKYVFRGEEANAAMKARIHAAYAWEDYLNDPPKTKR